MLNSNASAVVANSPLTPVLTGKMMRTIHRINDPAKETRYPYSLTDREIEFLKLVCTELTYKEIAGKMFLSARTIDGYRDALFEKLNAKSRVGLVLFTIKQGIVRL